MLKRGLQIFLSTYLIAIWLFGGLFHSFYHHLEDEQHKHKFSCVLETTDHHEKTSPKTITQDYCSIKYHLLDIRLSRLLSGDVSLPCSVQGINSNEFFNINGYVDSISISFNRPRGPPSLFS